MFRWNFARSCLLGCTILQPSLNIFGLHCLLITDSGGGGVANNLIHAKGNGTLNCFVSYKNSFVVHDRLGHRRTFVPSSLNAKSAKDIQSRFPVRLVVISSYVFIICKLRVPVSAVCSIRQRNSPFLVYPYASR